MRILLTALAALEVAAVIIVGTASPASAPDPSTVATAPASPAGLTVCGEAVEDNEVTRIAADEIFRLTENGWPACDATWAFTDTMTEYLGLAYDNDRNFIMLNTNPEHYTINDKPLDAMVRHVVRHEFGHQVTFVSYTAHDPNSDAQLAYLFTGDHDATQGHEIAADAIAAALGDDAAAYDPQTITLAEGLLSVVDTLGHL